MMIKIIFGFIFIVAGTCAGFVKADRLARRNVLLSELIVSLEYLKNEIYYTHERLNVVADRIAHMSEGKAAELFGRFADKLSDRQEEGVYDLWKESVEEAFPFYSPLAEQDAEAVCSLGIKLGRTDVEGQCSNIERSCRELSIRQAAAEMEAAQKSRIYRTLGTVTGIAFAILII
ncbi:MAG: hypothetical protein HFE90_08455 [Firmicutes bacterium]|nr:hypothetical protein [Bacillota bacterium]